MAPQRIHLVRHGEVENPEGVLYGRLDGFPLSERGRRMAKLAADDLVARGVPAARLVTSPLERTKESAAPIAEAFGLEPIVDDDVVEPWNVFEGLDLRARLGAWRDPRNLQYFARPWVPSWGEPYVEIVARMRRAIMRHAAAAHGGDVIVVSHQLPIWLVHRALRHQHLAHSPAGRRCALSSITSFEYHPATGFFEADYRTPAASELRAATDRGAV